MITSEYVHLIHWVVYIGSFLAFILLLTRFRKWGARWIAILYGSQVIFNGCLLVKLQNFYRVQEGLKPIYDGLLTDRFSSNHSGQLIVALVIITFAIVIIFIEKYGKRKTTRVS